MEGGWIGVDLDGTLAEYHGWNEGKIGAPIPAMVERVKAWLAQGVEVKIVTARVYPNEDGSNLREVMAQLERIGAWLRQHIGRDLEVTCFKDFRMLELWDDRAVQVIPNTGQRADGKP